ncbi:hypothetical protein ACWEQ8_28280 [Streptomyces noursei]
MLNENDVLAAVRHHIIQRGDPSPVEQPSNAKITWHSLLEGEILRCLETRTEHPRLHRGHLDLSGTPQYDSLHQHALDAPKELAGTTTAKLVKRGTVADQACPCGNGHIGCPRCQGRGELPCDPSAPCTDCPDTDPCLLCHGTRTRTGEPLGDQDRARNERTTCQLCGALDAACRTCRGRGKTTCTTCRGRGSSTCPNCDRSGTVTHEHCAGTGHTVTWTEGVIERRTRTEDVTWPPSGVSFVARQQARDNGRWSTASLTHHDPVPDDLETEFKKLLRPHLKKSEGEIAREAAFRYLPLARVEVPHRPHRVYYVFPGGTSLEVVPVLSPRRTWQLAGAVLATVVALYLVVQLIA